MFWTRVKFNNRVVSKSSKDSRTTNIWNNKKKRQIAPTRLMIFKDQESWT